MRRPLNRVVANPPPPPYLYCSLCNQPGIHGNLEINRILERWIETSPVEKNYTHINGTDRNGRDGTDRIGRDGTNRNGGRDGIDRNETYWEKPIGQMELAEIDSPMELGGTELQFGTEKTSALQDIIYRDILAGWN